MKSIIAVLLFSGVCFSQGKVYSVVQIDSIAKVNGRWLLAEGTINSEKSTTSTKKQKNGNVVKGKGGFSIKTYVNYYNQEYYDNLTRDEKKRYNREKDSELVKAIYNQVLFYDDKSGEKIFAEFYYHDTTLFYVKVKYTLISESSKEESQVFELNADDIADPKPVKNVLWFDVKSWVNKKNTEILEHHKQ
jgi:hypothetical protein